MVRPSCAIYLHYSDASKCNYSISYVSGGTGKSATNPLVVDVDYGSTIAASSNGNTASFYITKRCYYLRLYSDGRSIIMADCDSK